ncbi:MAG: terminase family protein [Nitrospiraceae bacterium]
MSNQATAKQVWTAMTMRYGVPAGEFGPERFFQEQLHVELDPWQIEASRAYGRGERHISIRACHGPGKTAWIAWCVVHSMLFRHPLKAVATAPSRGQLEGALMKEVAKWIGKLQPGLQALFEVGAMSVELKANPKGVSFEARTARPENPEALQGIHEDEGWVLIIVDEASGVHEKIFESAIGSMSGKNCQTILLANPTRTSGFFFRTHHQDKDMWFTLKVSHEDSKRVEPQFVEMVARQYGRESNAFRVRALGEFPLTDADTIIPYQLAIEAQEREIHMGEWLRPVWGVDVAYKGDDNNCLLKRNLVGVLPDIKVWGGTDTMQTAGRIMHEWEATPMHKRPPEILVDIIGYGAGVHDRLLELGLPVRGINVSETDSVDPRFRNMSTQLWWRCREWLEDKGHTLPICDGSCPDKQSCVHDRLIMEMTSRQYDHTSTGRLLIESKKDMKKRGYKSPDVADALMLTFASDLATLVHGSDGWGASQSWNEPVNRGRAHV